MCIGNHGGGDGLGENPGYLNSQILNPQGWDSAILKTYQKKKKKKDLPSNVSAAEDSSESLGQQGVQTSQS